MSRIVRFHRTGGPEVLQIDTSDPARLASCKLKPVIAKTFPFEQIVEAHKYLESNVRIGKVVASVA